MMLVYCMGIALAALPIYGHAVGVEFGVRRPGNTEIIELLAKAGATGADKIVNAPPPDSTKLKQADRSASLAFPLLVQQVPMPPRVRCHDFDLLFH